MSDILITIPSELVQYNHDKKKDGKGTETITLNITIPVSWTYGIDGTNLADFLKRHVCGMFREPSLNFKVIEDIEVKIT